MSILKKVSLWIAIILAIPVVYIAVSLILTSITVDKEDTITACDKSIFLNTNGVHLDIIIPRHDIDLSLQNDINQIETAIYVSFGWGDENFYINTPTWADLTFSNAFLALFMKSSTLMHVTRYRRKRNGWVEIKINQTELRRLNSFINESFTKDKSGYKIMLEDQGYSSVDDFYKANGSYSCFKTCNSWVNTGLQDSGLKSCYWTPFDFGLMKKYK